MGSKIDATSLREKLMSRFIPEEFEKTANGDFANKFRDRILRFEVKQDGTGERITLDSRGNVYQRILFSDAGEPVEIESGAKSSLDLETNGFQGGELRLGSDGWIYERYGDPKGRFYDIGHGPSGGVRGRLYGGDAAMKEIDIKPAPILRAD